ncbi:hypothetical protein [Enterococcus sp. DIV1059_2]|uniref:hypothetical protein n=1 Tax=Enterococcus sp. DIV1059_2 TaxID=2774664 RepID=UPI003F29D834
MMNEYHTENSSSGVQYNPLIAKSLIGLSEGIGATYFSWLSFLRTGHYQIEQSAFYECSPIYMELIDLFYKEITHLNIFHDDIYLDYIHVQEFNIIFYNYGRSARVDIKSRDGGKYQLFFDQNGEYLHSSYLEYESDLLDDEDGDETEGYWDDDYDDE